MTQVLTVEGEPGTALGLGEGQDQTVTLVRPLLGFPGSTRFVLASLGERYAPFLLLSSLDEPGLDFIVVRPGLLFDDYVVEIAASDVALLGLAEPDDVDTLVLVSRHPGATPTVNLMGPLVLNSRTRTATQVVLQDGRYAAVVSVDAKTAETGFKGGAGSR